MNDDEKVTRLDFFAAAAMQGLLSSGCDSRVSRDNIIASSFNFGRMLLNKIDKENICEENE